MDQKELGLITEDFTRNGNKAGCYFLMAANTIGLPDEKIKKYLKPELPPEQLMEMLIAIYDEIPEKVLDIFLKNAADVDLDEMRARRFDLRGDSIYQTLSERVHSLGEEINKVNDSLLELKGMSDDLKELKKLTKSVAEIRKMISNSNVSDKTKVETSKKEEEVMQDTILASENGRLPKCDYTVYTNNTPSLIETTEEGNKDSRFKSLFRRGNKNKIITDEEAKMKVLNEIIAMQPEEEKLLAIIDAGKRGIPMNFIRHYIDKKASPEMLRLYTESYLAFFGEKAGEHA